MPRKPSESTKLRRALTELKHFRGALALCKVQREQLQNQVASLTEDRDEWKARFDKLLERMGEEL